MSTHTPIDKAQAKTFVLSAIALSSGTFNLGFWYGVYETVFFEQLFFVWVAATVALIACVWMRNVDVLPAKLQWYGYLTLALPTVWLAVEVFSDVDPATSWLMWFVTLLVAFGTLPYLLYLIILIVVPDIEQLDHPRLRFAVIGIAALMGLSGLFIGANHSAVLTCDDFEIAGDHVPDDCRKAKPSS